MSKFEDVTGRYLNVEIDGIQYRGYVEEVGEGIPLMLQHTAGSDSRQYRFLMNDEEVTSKFKLIAYDLPFHGKSLPPLNIEWWKDTYSLKRDFFMKYILALKDALNLEQPVFMGSSMGGHMAADLAYYHPDKFSAVIGLEAALYTEAENMPTLRYLSDNPQIGRDYLGYSMYSAMAPDVPERFKQEIAYCYNQGGPGIFAGDIDYYAFDHDLRGKADQIDTRECMVYLLWGEYDFATPPEVCQKLADEIKGCKGSLMKGLGHFPMTESYLRFKNYLMPFLNEIVENR
ncbi:alpha/beta hydrolase [Acidaminobacter sp. JC074]|uniref:alpha/beta fold hydrolase n=1 Tax=Acidaminobacter sp. JC074 TaxID=2530199 RepID=UPI001F10A333|nr:alpha/beta hydrolase [Acidaminobacter sp. JC074]MCH4886455.1 alpha/beta hydrolase [Acidaminobacter sp. JC074]